MNRSKEVSNLSRECYHILLPHLDKIADKMNSPMELSYFLAGLSDMLSITINLKLANLLMKEVNNEK